MNIGEKLIQNLISGPLTGASPFTAEFPESGWNAQIDLEHRDIVGSIIRELNLERTGDRPDELTTQAWAESIAARASGLLERFAFLEYDSTQDEALLRSDVPSQKQNHLSYYELRLKGTSKAVLRRYQFERGSKFPREQVSFALTHEVLQKLIDDITS